LPKEQKIVLISKPGRTAILPTITDFLLYFCFGSRLYLSAGVAPEAACRSPPPAPGFYSLKLNAVWTSKASEKKEIFLGECWATAAVAQWEGVVLFSG
jgi:hypothetical protein